MNEFFAGHPGIVVTSLFGLGVLTGIGCAFFVKLWIDGRKASTPAYKSRVTVKPMQPIVLNYGVKAGAMAPSTVRFDITTASKQTAVGDDQGVKKVDGVKTGDFVTVTGPNADSFKVEVTTGVSSLAPTTVSFDVPAVADASVGAGDVLDPEPGAARMVSGVYVTDVVVKMHAHRGAFTILEI